MYRDQRVAVHLVVIVVVLMVAIAAGALYFAKNNESLGIFSDISYPPSHTPYTKNDAVSLSFTPPLPPDVAYVEIGTFKQERFSVVQARYTLNAPFGNWEQDRDYYLTYFQTLPAEFANQGIGYTEGLMNIGIEKDEVTLGVYIKYLDNILLVEEKKMHPDVESCFLAVHQRYLDWWAEQCELIGQPRQAGCLLPEEVSEGIRDDHQRARNKCLGEEWRNDTTGGSVLDIFPN